MGKPAARIGDYHSCPAVNPGPSPHVGGPVCSASSNVITGGKPQGRVTDKCVCNGPPDVIVKGSATVLVNGKPAARMGDNTAHGGVIVAGLSTVLIGDAAAGGEAGGGTLSNEGWASFLEGFILGGFSDNDSWSKVAGQVVAGFVPYYGQAADARDVAAAIAKIRRGDPEGWNDLGLSAIAIVPGLGDAAKGVLRGGRKSVSALRPLARSKISAERATHILYGDMKGGGHLYPGKPGKSTFPEDWSEHRVLDEINRIAIDDTAPARVQADGRVVKFGHVDGIDIKVVQESPSKGGGVVTAYPANRLREPQ